MKHFLLLWFIFMLTLMDSVVHLQAQNAGTNTLQVLDLTSSSRAASMGMDYLSLYTNDINLAIDNPSLMGDYVNSRLTLNYTNLFAGASFGSIAYGHHFEKLPGNFVFSMRFNSYGMFDCYDEAEIAHGRFDVGDYLLGVGYGLNIDSLFSVGVNLKPLLSQYESYTSFSVAVDICGSFVSSDRQFSATLMARNVGNQLATINGIVERLPFEISLALSYQLANAPFRIYGQFAELQQWDLRYNDPFNPTWVYDPYEGTYIRESLPHRLFDQTFRHVNFGVEFSMHQVFYLRAGYNYRQAKEMVGSNNLNFSGFSFGVGLHRKRFIFDYAHRTYHLGQGLNYISLTFKI